MSITPIQTEYKGHWFRSRLEARWAVFFDTAGIPYRYEEEGYNVEGTWYLPDFWLPDQGCWIEIKGPPPSSEELRTMKTLVRGTGSRGYIIAGDIPYPYPTEGWIVGYDWGDSGRAFREVRSASWAQCPVCLKVDIADDINGWSGVEGKPGCGCVARLMRFFQELILGSGTEQTLFEASADETHKLTGAIHRVFKVDPLYTTSETTLLKDAYYAARRVRFDRHDPPLSLREKAQRVETNWTRILTDLSYRGHGDAATYFGWLEVVGFAGDALELCVSEGMAALADRANRSDDSIPFPLIAQISSIKEPFVRSVQRCCGIEIERLSVSAFPRKASREGTETTT